MWQVNSSARQIFRIALLLSIVCLGILAWIDQSLKTSSSPLGIVSFQMCAYASSCQSVVSSWSAHSRLMAALSLGFDYLFMVAYPVTMFLAWHLLGQQRGGKVALWAPRLASLSLPIGVFDAVENAALSRMLLLPTDASLGAWPWLASGSATLKFLLLVISLGGLVVVVLRNWSASLHTER